jgi:hypothetical protein
VIHQDLDHSHGLKLFFSDLKYQIAKLEQEYKKHGIYYHSNFPDLRNEKYGDYEREPATHGIQHEIPSMMEFLSGYDGRPTYNARPDHETRETDTQPRFWAADCNQRPRGDIASSQ